jgi:hypothetical protein
MSFMKNAFAAAAVVALNVGAAEAATYTYVGSWDVYNDATEYWYNTPPDGPVAYTGQEAAAFLFGGAAGDYVISTISSLAADIDFSAWYDVIGYGKALFAQDYSNKYLGQYYGPTSGFGMDIDGAASALIKDNLEGLGGVNYAFTVSNVAPSTVPLPAAGWLLVAGIGGIAAMRRRKSAA